MNVSKFAIILGLGLSFGLVVACEEPIGIQTETHSIKPEGANRANVELRMGAGELTLRGGAGEALLDGTFVYNRRGLKPEVDYSVLDDKGILKIHHGKHSGFSFGNTRNEWDLRLGNTLPVDLRVNLGAGESHLDLRGIKVSELEIDMGMGQMTLDLQGDHSRSFDVRIDGGVGSAKIYLPADVGVRIRVDGGIGSVSTRGLKKERNTYTNESYGRSDVTIDIDIDAGIGSLDLRVESQRRIEP